MKRLILILIVGFVAWQGYTKYQRQNVVRVSNQEAVETIRPATLPTSPQEDTSSSQFRCDGRTYCSQMTSCAEVTFFLRNCPGVKMDGDSDGVPCELQWCK
jgi:hypothetical protein